MKKRPVMIARIVLFVVLTLVAAGFLLPTLLTVTNAFMSGEELLDHYGAAFDSLSQGGGNMAEYVQLQLWPSDFTPRQFAEVLLQSPAYLLKFWNSVLLTLPIVLGQAAVAAMAAYSLARVRNRARTVTFFFYVVLMLMPYQVTLVPNYLVAKWLGVLGTRWAVIFPGVFAPFSVFLLARFMQRIPSAQFEAAQLDGAGEWRLFTRICLPQCCGVIYAVMILVFLDYWNMVEQPLVLLDSSAQHPLSVFLSEINAQDAAVAFAAATVYMIPPMLLFLHGERHLIAGIAQSGSFSKTSEEPRRRRWVVVTAAVFLTALFVLTMVAGPLSERLTPSVTVSDVIGGTIGSTFFEQALPHTAVLSDSEGSYVLVVREQQSAFGTRYRAERVSVKILARDDEKIAVESTLTSWDKVMVTASKLPKDGQYVQLAEE